MINLTCLNKEKFILNADHIERLEEVPDTIITLTNGKKYIVTESLDEVVKRVIAYKNKIFNLNV